eukprot:1140539-Pelagomonas_calceolata.AAC.1
MGRLWYPLSVRTHFQLGLRGLPLQLQNFRLQSSLQDTMLLPSDLWEQHQQQSKSEATIITARHHAAVVKPAAAATVLCLGLGFWLGLGQRSDSSSISRARCMRMEVL